MSRAFVKEPDGDDLADDQPERPQSPHPNYVTPAGLERLKSRRAELDAERRRLAAEPDNLAYKLPLSQVGREIRYLDGRIERAIVVDPARQPTDEVGFGAVVEVVDEDGVSAEYAIVSEDEADAKQGRVSYVSPLARALMGAGRGDVITWQRPSGEVELEILSIRYPDA